MRRPILILLLMLPLLSWAQGERPGWCDADTRRLAYPDKSYFTGYATGQRNNGESLSDVLARTENAARADAARHIEVRVESSTLSRVESLLTEGRNTLDESVQSYFSQKNHSTTDIQISNLQVLSWHSDDGSEAAAIAFVKRRDFARYHDRQIEAALGKMEVALENIAQQEQQGAKFKAVATAEEALQLCPDVEYSQRMLALADPEASGEDLQTARYNKTVQRLSAAIERLRHATAFFIECRASIGGKPYTLLDKDVRGQLATKGCHFTNDRQAADWVVAIDAEVISTSHKEGMAHFAFVDGTLTILNGKTGQKVHDNRLSTLDEGHHDGIKGGDFNPDKASRIAFSNAAKIISNAILKLVQE